MDDKTKIALLGQDLEYLKASSNENNELIKKVIERMDRAEDKEIQRIKELDSKYASKWVESVMVGMIGIALTAVVGALVGLVVIKPNLSMVVKKMEYSISLIQK